MRRNAFFALSVLLLTAAATFAAPSAVLLDTSRSVPPSRFQEVKGTLGELLPALAASGPVAVYTFDDAPTRIADFSQDSAGLRASLDGVTQSGAFTLLYDAVFAAAKDLEGRGQGGVILLVTDGRDENSAVTLEDVAGRCESAGVRVVTLGIGTGVNTRMLRRLATLTGGQMAGELPGAEPEAIRNALETSLKSVQGAPPPAEPGKPHTVPQPVSPQAPTPEAKPAGLPLLWILVPLVLAVLAISAAIFFLVLKRTKPVEERSCQKCGRELNLWETECPFCLAKALSITNPGLTSEQGSTPVAPALPELDPALLQKTPTQEMLENTIVMDEVPVLVLKRGSNPPRMFQLPPDQVVSVGRDKVNTISIADPTLSGQHFRIVPKEGVYYLVDLHSTNGTFMGGERVTLKEIPAGGMIHAGQCDFHFRMEQKRIGAPPA